MIAQTFLRTDGKRLMFETWSDEEDVSKDEKAELYREVERVAVIVNHLDC